MECIDFIETQLIEYAAYIDYDFFRYPSDNDTEFLDFFEWYLDQGFGDIVEIEICITAVNFLFLKNFDPYIFVEEEGDLI